MKFSVFDICVSDWNTGNRIIMESVYSILYELFPDYSLVSLPYIEPFGEITMEHIVNSQFLFFGGGNVLTSDLDDLFWGITQDNVKKIQGTILFGTGWWQYQHDPTEEVGDVYKKVLNNKFYHSVRDNYTKTMLAKAGIDNVLVTGCPTLWELTTDHCATVPSKKADNVLFTFTADYSKNYQRDSAIIDTLKKSYEQLYFWPQGPEDCEYIKNFSFDGTVLPANLPALDNFLSNNESIEYVGTRLHAGIKALQKKRRALIIGIDNRAKEKQLDFDLPVLSDSNIDRLYSLIHSERECRIQLPQKNIQLWKNQFHALNQ